MALKSFQSSMRRLLSMVKHEMKYSYGTFEIPMPEEERDRPSRRNYYKSWVYRTQLSTSKLHVHN